VGGQGRATGARVGALTAAVSGVQVTGRWAACRGERTGSGPVPGRGPRQTAASRGVHHTPACSQRRARLHGARHVALGWRGCGLGSELTGVLHGNRGGGAGEGP